MNNSNSQTAYGVFKPVGHVLASFPNERDGALGRGGAKSGGRPEVRSTRPRKYSSGPERDIRNSGVLANIGQELNLVKQQRDLAEQGHPFISVLAEEDDAARPRSRHRRSLQRRSRAEVRPPDHRRN